MVWGEENIAFEKELTYRMDAYVENLHIEYIPDYSHWIKEEHPQLVNPYIIDESFCLLFFPMLTLK